MKRMHLLCLVGLLVVAGYSVRAADALKVDDEGFIRNWLLLGPISLADTASNHDEDNQKDFFNKEQFEGQFKATPKEGDKVKVGGTEMAFSRLNADGGIFNFTEQDNSMNIIVTYVVAENDIPDVKLSIGSDDSSCWRLNEQEVIRVFEGRGVEQDQNKSQPLTLKKGVNVLVGAVINGGGPTGACARFLDKDDKPVKNITIQLTK